MLVGQFIDTEKSTSLRLVKVFLGVIIFWLTCDSIAQIIEGKNAPDWILWILNFVCCIMPPLFLLSLALFGNAYLTEHGKCSKWWFTAPAIVLGVLSLGYIIDFFVGIAGYVDNGVFIKNDDFQFFTLVIYLVFIVYSSALSFIFHKEFQNHLLIRAFFPAAILFSLSSWKALADKAMIGIFALGYFALIH